MLASGCCERLTWRTARLDWNATSITWVKRNADCVGIALRLRNGNVADLGATRWTADCWLRHRAADLGCAGHRAARRCWNVAGSCTTSVTAAAHLRNALVLIFTENFYCDVNRWKARRWLMKFSSTTDELQNCRSIWFENGLLRWHFLPDLKFWWRNFCPSWLASCTASNRNKRLCKDIRKCIHTAVLPSSPLTLCDMDYTARGRVSDKI